MEDDRSFKESSKEYEGEEGTIKCLIKQENLMIPLPQAEFPIIKQENLMIPLPQVEFPIIKQENLMMPLPQAEFPIIKQENLMMPLPQAEFPIHNQTSKFDDTVASSGISNTKEQEITILRHEIKEQQKYLNQYQLILSSLKEVTNKSSTGIPNSTVSAHMSRKVNTIIGAEQARQFFQNCPMESHPLGLLEVVSPSKDSQLLYDESTVLRTAVEERVAEKCNFMVTNEKNELALSKQSIDRSNILKLDAELDKVTLNYNQSLIQSCNIMKEICDSYVVPMAKINESRATCLEKELRATELKSKFLECKLITKTYSEDKNILPCIEKIDASLKLEMESLSLELKKLRIEKAKYDQLRESEEYRRVLTEYHEIKKSIKDKKWLLRQC